jgi:hypothetical protein
MLEQRQRSGWQGLRPNAAAMAAALRASQHELAFLMGHPLWLPFSLAPLLQALRYSPPLLLDVLLAALLERHLLIPNPDPDPDPDPNPSPNPGPNHSPNPIPNPTPNPNPSPSPNPSPNP